MNGKAKVQAGNKRENHFGHLGRERKRKKKKVIFCYFKLSL